MTSDTPAASVVSVPGVVAEYFHFAEHVLGRTSLPDIPARIRAGEFVWIDLDLAIADLNILQDVVPIDDDCRSCLQRLADQTGDVQSEPISSVRRSERLLHITMVGAVSREGSIDWDRCDVVIGEGFLLTLHREPSAVLAVVRRDYEHDFQKYAKTSSFLIYEIWNAQINQFIALEGELENDVESVRLALHDEVNETTLDRLSHMSAKLMVLRKRVLPVRRVLEELVSRKTALISDATLEFFGTMIGTLDRLLADIDANREILESAVNLSLTFTAHRTNMTMNRLAVVSTIFLPLTFLCGVYGMNFEVLPEVRWAHGYAYFWVLSAIITIVLVVLLRRLRLL
jgi:magnesium/cobalt transport protein CorA